MGGKLICVGYGIDCDPSDSLCLKFHDSLMETDTWQLKTLQEWKNSTKAAC